MSALLQEVVPTQSSATTAKRIDSVRVTDLNASVMAAPPRVFPKLVSCPKDSQKSRAVQALSGKSCYFFFPFSGNKKEER